MKIGVAVPCYIGHIPRLYELLDSIENQTVLPTKVVVSCSSTSECPLIKEYSFPLEIICCEHKMNPSQNRNIASSKLLDMDYITFIDADDIFHSRKIEILLKVIEDYGVDVLLHNYSRTHLEPIDNIIVRNSLVKAPSGCITHSDCDDRIYRLHHSEITVKRYILDKVSFPEEIEFLGREDCVFCYRVFSLPNITHRYIQNELSLYIFSDSMFV